MRFVVTGEWTRAGLMKLIVSFFLVYVSLFWLTNALLFFSRLGLSYSEVVEAYLGRSGPFGGEAIGRSYKVLLEVSHAHLFAMGILIMTMTHLLLFVPTARGAHALLVVITFISALLDEGAGWLIRFVDPAFAYLKIGAFLTFQASLLAIIVLVAWVLWRPAE